MFDRSSLQYWATRFLLGLGLIAAAGFRIVPRVLHVPDSMGLLTLLLGLTGFFMAWNAVTPMVRIVIRDRQLRGNWSEAATAAFARASLPRRVYYLLASVAEADGPMTAAERETVRHFVLERFGDPVQVAELQTWEAQPLPIVDRVGLAARIATGLGESELDSLFCWCCLVAFADGRFQDGEHAALHDVQKGLGIPGARARMLFHLARSQFVRGDRRGERAAPAGNAGAPTRMQALEVLGLPADATADQIRKRHRELVRKFHPDAQPSLGPVAQREATERFTAIQRAYETLTA
ncbi:MAG: DnaJ domain-containing protein [Planctomycetes bacterium]|jgi:DnaJ-domain-containing protein 1|nr:DnaJ domain-containing protein [Planctomycetota bacterium]